MTDDEQRTEVNVIAHGEGHFTDYGWDVMCRLYFQALLAHGEVRVTDNGDDTYTYVWTAKPHDELTHD